jgi:hypothetical protein
VGGPGGGRPSCGGKPRAAAAAAAAVNQQRPRARPPPPGLTKRYALDVVSADILHASVDRGACPTAAVAEAAELNKWGGGGGAPDPSGPWL